MSVENVMEMTESERIKYYIKRYKEVPNADPADIARTRRTKGTGGKSVYYTVTLSSGLDAVIERHKGSEVTQMILMPSQDKYLFKEDSVVQNIKTMDFDHFKIFFSSWPEEGIVVNNVIIDTIKKSEVQSLYNMIISHSDDLHKGILSFNIFKYDTLMMAMSRTDPKVWKMLVTKTGMMKNPSKYNGYFVDLVNYFYTSPGRGYDAAMAFADAYTKSSMMDVELVHHAYYYGYGRRDPIDYSTLNSLDAKRLIEYLCFDLYAQGYERIPLNTYMDYLSMCISYEDKVKDKYPKALLTEHDKISLKCTLAKKEIDKKRFKAENDKFKRMIGIKEDTVFEYKDKVMILPTDSKELIDEGQNLGHCVGTYIERVANGNCIIAFVRKKAEMDSSYLTVEFAKRNEYGSTGYTIAQIQGDNKRTILTLDEIKFFENLMEKFSFDTVNRNLK